MSFFFSFTLQFFTTQYQFLKKASSELRAQSYQNKWIVVLVESLIQLNPYSYKPLIANTGSLTPTETKEKIETDRE